MLKSLIDQLLASKLFSLYQKYFGVKLVKFLLAGLPSFLVAAPINWFLVEQLGVNKGLSYACVLYMQVTINFFVCRFWVFDAAPDKSLGLQYFQFLTGIFFFRLMDWGLYYILVSLCGFFYLGVQVCNIVIFAFLKFHFSKQVIERKTRNECDLI